MAEVVSKVEERVSLLLFSLAGVCHAIATKHVVRVIESQRLLPMPHLPPALLGVVAISGKVVPVLDLGRLLGLGPCLNANEMLVVAIGNGIYAMAVDRVLQVGLFDISEDLFWRGQAVRLVALETLLAAQADAAPPRPSLAAASLAIAPAAPAERPNRQADCLAIESAGGALVFLPLHHVVELCETLSIVRLPDPRPQLVGGAFHRGALVPVVALDVLLMGISAPTSQTAPAFGGFVIIDVDGRRCALAVKRVIGMAAQAAATIDLRRDLAEFLIAGDGAPQAYADRVTSRDDGGMDYLLAAWGRRLCAFNLASVAHLHEAGDVIRTPRGTHAGVIGAAAIGGRVLPVIDVASQIGLPPPPVTASPMIELKSPSGAFVVPVDFIVGIVPITPEVLIEAPDDKAIMALARYGDELIWLIDTSAIADAKRDSDAA